MENIALDRLLKALDLAVLRLRRDRSFQLISEKPPWWGCLDWTAADAPQTWKLTGGLSFLDNFLDDAEPFWKTAGQGRLASGMWNESKGGKDYLFEAQALNLDGCSLLVIERLDQGPEGRPALLRKAREYQFSYENEIARRARLERELRQAQQAAQALDRAKSEFLANMSHEIRTPMNGIIGVTELLLGSETTAQQQDYLNMVKESAASLLQIINGVLDLAKIEAGTLALKTAPFDLRRLLDDTLTLLEVQARVAGLALTWKVNPAVPNRLVGAPDQMRQILVNLVGNAVKFTEKGAVEVRVGLESPSATDPVLHFWVIDSGIGIPPENQKTIFDSFVQVEGSMDRRRGGTGLGLAICARLVGQLGGRIWVESQVGQGSTFHFTLPCQIQPDPAPESAALALEPRPRQTWRPLDILLAEDHPVNQKLTVHLLEKWGHRVQVAGNGRQALALWQKRHFDIILMDVQMPAMDGLETTAAIRTKETENHVPIVAMTAQAMQGDHQRCIEAGMDAYLPKPIEQAALFDTIERLANLGSAPAPSAAVAGSPLDQEALRRRFGSAPDLLADIIQLFWQHAPVQVDRILQAAAAQDAESLRRAAHTLKGAVSNFGAGPAFRAAQVLEDMGDANQFDGVKAACRDLDRELAALKAALAVFVPDHSP